MTPASTFISPRDAPAEAPPQRTPDSAPPGSPVGMPAPGSDPVEMPGPPGGPVEAPIREAPEHEPGQPEAPEHEPGQPEAPEHEPGEPEAPAREPEAPARAPGAPEPDAVAAVEGVSARLGGRTIVEDLTFQVAPGTILGLIGPSGAGKTTTIRLLTGALRPAAGRVRILGEDPRKLSQRSRRRVAYMPQLFTLWRDLSTRENVDLVASLYGLLWGRRRSQVRSVLGIVDLWDARNRRAGDLSGGMQRRLELACALVHDPWLGFLDEPTAGVDPLLRAAIWRELHERKDAGRSFVVTTQYVGEAEECDQVALISDGRLVALGTPDELRRTASDGDVVELETEDPFDAQALAGLDGIRSVEQLGSRRLRAVVEDAGTASPDLIDAIEARGGDVSAVREVRLSFDDVFAELVRRDRAARAGDADPAEEAGDPGSTDDSTADPAADSTADPISNAR